MNRNLKKLSILALSLAVIFAFSACGTEKETAESETPASEPETEAEAPELTPTETVEGFLTALKAGDTEKMNEYYELEDTSHLTDLFSTDSNEEAVLGGKLMKILKEKAFDFDYSISNEQVDDDMATVDVTITTYEFGEALSEVLNEYVETAITLYDQGASEKDLDEAFDKIGVEKFDKLNEKTYSETITLDLLNENGYWEVCELDSDSQFMNALTGGIQKVTKKLEEEMNSQQ